MPPGMLGPGLLGTVQHTLSVVQELPVRRAVHHDMRRRPRALPGQRHHVRPLRRRVQGHVLRRGEYSWGLWGVIEEWVQGGRGGKGRGREGVQRGIVGVILEGVQGGG